MSDIPTPISPAYPDISTLWGYPLQPAHCPQCGVAHLIPQQMETALCPACFGARLEPQPTVIRSEPPELVLDFAISPAQVQARFEAWLKGVWLRPKELAPGVLTQRLTRTFVPMWLVDGQVQGSWQAQMGYDYEVASSQEVFRGGRWTTRKLTETRIRWEPRSGTVERTYENLNVPALDEYARLVKGLGQFDLSTALKYTSASLDRASVRVPSLLPEAAWPFAKSGFDRLTANDCQKAAAAQHVDEFTIEAEYENQNWTQLLLPVYTTAYRDENGKVYSILVHGQNGKIFGVRRASQRQARNWSLGIAALALICFVLGLLFAAGTAVAPPLGAISLLFFGAALMIGVISPIPAIWAWNFNQKSNS
jgi:hypothetical protein